MDEHTVSVEYSKELLVAAVRAFWLRFVKRRLGWKYLLALGLIGIATAQRVSAGDRSWFLPFLLGALAFAILFLVATYFLRRHYALSRFRQMQSPVATFTFRDADFTMSSDLGSSTLPWRTVTEVWRYPEFWLLFISKGQFITLPLSSLDLSTREFIGARLTVAKKT
jgi:YcxB-like protein